MARIGGTTIPDNKKVKVALTYIYGIGLTSAQNILKTTSVNPDTRVKDLTDAELNRIRDEIAKNYVTEGELQRVVTQNIKRLKDINCYRGLRHKLNLPVRGQRTRTNARTKRGRRQTVGGIATKAPTKT